MITDKGKILFQEIEDKIIWKEHFYRDFLPYQSYGKTYPKDDKLRDIVFNQLRDENISLKESIRTIYSAQSVKQRIKRCLKSVIDRMPDGIISLVRMIYYKFNRC